VPAADCLRQLRGAGADVVGFNCQVGPRAALRILEGVPVEEGTLLSVYPNAGKPEFFEGRYIYFGAPEYFARMVPLLVAQGARLIGGCCGTTPETIAAMAQGRHTLVVTRGGRPIAALMPIATPADIESLKVSRSPTFQALIAESRRVNPPGTGLTTAQVRRALAPRRSRRVRP